MRAWSRDIKILPIGSLEWWKKRKSLPDGCGVGCRPSNGSHWWWWGLVSSEVMIASWMSSVFPEASSAFENLPRRFKVLVSPQETRIKVIVLKQINLNQDVIVIPNKGQKFIESGRQSLVVVSEFLWSNFRKQLIAPEKQMIARCCVRGGFEFIRC